MHEYLWSIYYICMNIYRPSNIRMTIHGASNICMDIYGAFIRYYPYAFIIYGIHYLISWISTHALRQKLRIGETSTVAHNYAFGMGLDPKLRAHNLIKSPILGHHARLEV